MSIHGKVSQKHQSLVVPGVPGVLAMFSGCPQLPDGNVIVPHGFRETLDGCGTWASKSRPPLMYYDYAGGNPYAVQRKTVEMLVENPRAYVLNHMGTGKN
jgi:hypothetical protein